MRQTISSSVAAAAVAAAIVAAALVATGGSFAAQATTGTKPPAAKQTPGKAPQKTLVADPLPTWQVSGKVWALAYARGVVYVGGTFNSVRPPGKAPGQGEVKRKNFAAFDARTGHLLDCAPNFRAPKGVVPSIQGMEAGQDGQTLYIGGRFTTVNRGRSANFVALDTAQCRVRGGFPNFGGAVGAFAPTATGVYVGGSFTSVDGRARTRLAELSLSGKLLSWRPSADKSVEALTMGPDGKRLWAGGAFRSVNGAQIQGVVALNPNTGSVVQSFPGWITGRTAVKALAHDGNYVYLAAEGTGAGQFDGRIAADIDTGALKWRDNCTGATQDVLPVGSILYSASHNHDCSHDPHGFPNYAMDGRQHLLAQSIADKTILPWFPDTDEGINGVGPQALVMGARNLWVGGEFTSVNKSPQQGLTRFPPGPDTGAPARVQPTARAVGSGVADIRWAASWDRDDGNLVYSLFRSGTRKAIYRTRVNSRYWHRPIISYRDKHLEAGKLETYRVKVSDGINRSRLSRPAHVRIARYTDFRSPDHNIFCRIFNSGGHRNSAVCDIHKHRFHAPPKPPSCHQHWGRTVKVRSTRGGWDCSGGPATSSTDVKTLAAGHMRKLGNIRCTSRAAAMVCRNIATHHGFTLSRQAVTLL